MLGLSVAKKAAVKLFAVALLCASAAFAAPGIESEFGKKEVEYGKEAAAQIAKENKLVKDSPDLKRVRELGNKLAAIANKTEIKALYGSSKITPFEYTFNIIEDDDINAFSVPGGFIYVNTGLLKFVESDQELAAVLAHEIVHASHHHMVYLLSRQASLNNQMAIAMLATILSGAKNTDVGNVMLGAQLYQISKLSGYGMEAERDADQGAILYMREAGMNPVGLLTFLERLARRPELVNLGIYRSHPLDADRVRAAKQLINDLNIPLNRRETTRAVSAEVKTEKVNGADMQGVYINGKLIYRAADAEGKQSAELTKSTADRINASLDSGLQLRELKTDPAAGKITARDKAIVTVTEADARLMGKTIAEITNAAGNAIRNVLWKQMVDTVH